MSTNDQGKKETLSLGRPNKLSLTKTVEGGKVKQNFQHGRSKTVQVEVRRTRNFMSNDSGTLVEVKKDGATAALADMAKSKIRFEGDEDHQLTQGEQEARLKALKSAEEEAKTAPKSPSPAMSRPRLKEDGYSAASDGLVIAPDKKAPHAADMPADDDNKKKAGFTVAKPKTDTEESAYSAKKPPKMKLRSDEGRRTSGKITVTQALGLAEERMRSLASIRRQREKAKKAETGSQPAEKFVREIVVPEAITVQELANRMAARAVDVVKFLMKMGTMVTANQAIDADTAELIVTEFGHKIKRVSEGDVENVLREEAEAPEALLPRPPVVTIMGHVDHGKTSLLDALRKTDVVAGEAGGITQHIGAYQVELGTGEKITFLDTPGHEAFTAMRMRGARATDIVVLVVAADDGIMEQTKEAISHAKMAEVPIIVAINKVDKQGADPARVRQELMQYDLIPEEFGGEVITVEVSAKEKIGLDKLQEAILLQAEVLELTANPHRSAGGVVIEARVDAGRGVVATLLVQRGTLKIGDIVVAGSAYGRVRALGNDKGKSVTEVFPSEPIEILGLNQVPEAGDEFAVVENEKTAREITEYREKRTRTQNVVAAKTLENLFSSDIAAKELPLIVKADVQGSAEAIVSSVTKLSTDEVAVKIVHSGVGAISESDITLAQATGAVLIGFNVRAAAKARTLSDKAKIGIRYYSIIYNVVDDIKAALSGMLSPTRKENFLGYAEIREVFNVSKSGKVAGCMVTEGIIRRGAKVRLLRDNVVIHEGTLSTLKRFKDDAKEVKSGLECGMAFENYENIQVGDMIEAFEVEEIARTI